MSRLTINAFIYIFATGQLCRDTPEDGKGCRYWTYFPKQKRTCFLLNACDQKIDGYGEEALSAERSCNPLDFMLALGKTLSNNIAALKDAKRAIEAEAQSSDGGGVTNCADFITRVEQCRFAQALKNAFLLLFQFSYCDVSREHADCICGQQHCGRRRDLQ